MNQNHKKRILFVVSTMTTGGINTSLSALYNKLKDLYEIKVFALDYDKTISLGYTEALLPKDKLLDAYHCDYSKADSKDKRYKWCVKFIKRISMLIRFDLQSYIFKRAAKHIERTWKFDVIVSFQEGQPTCFCSYFKNPKKIAWVHCDYIRYYPNAYVYSNYKKIVFVSNYTKTAFVDKYPEYSTISDYVYNFIDTERIRKLSSEPLENDGFDSSDFTIISMGRIVGLKRFSYIPIIASDLQKKGFKFKWYILGPSFDKNESSLLEENIKKYDVGSCVYWLGNKSNPYPYLKKSSLLVALSTTEACPMMFIEAKILNIPILSTNFGSSYEFICNGEDGVISNIESISYCIGQLIGDNDKYLSIKKKTIDFSYSNQDLTNKVVSIIESI